MEAPMPRPTTRVLALLELLQANQQLSGKELAQRLTVDGRTLRRYVAALEEIGIPISTELGRYGGYRLVPGFKLPPMMFTDDEAQALSLGLLAVRGLGLADATPAIESVQAKLDRVLPAALKKRTAALRETIALPRGGAVVGADGRLVRLLSEAAQMRCTVLLHYRAVDGARTARGFDVYGLVFRGGRWYVVGHCHLRAGLRSLRVDRIAHADISQQRFIRPEGFDAAAYLTRALATLPRAMSVEVRLHTDLATAQQEIYEMLGTLEPCGDGVLLHATADDLGWFARQLIALPFGFEVQTPAALRSVLARIGARLVAEFGRATGQASESLVSKRGGHATGTRDAVLARSGGISR
jgi:predicted DNA-binding transcriptional regulator YafY